MILLVRVIGLESAGQIEFGCEGPGGSRDQTPRDRRDAVVMATVSAVADTETVPHVPHADPLKLVPLFNAETDPSEVLIESVLDELLA